MDSVPPVATLQDVADRAGVSRATASQALSGKGRLSTATRERVREAAEALDYSVNMFARSLRTARSGAIGLYVPDQTLSYRYYMDVAFGAVERAQESDLLVTLLPPAFQPRSTITDQLDGFLMIDAVDGDPVVAKLLSGRKPVVSGERTPADLPQPWATVFGDHDAGMRLLLDHVWERGSRRPAVLLPDGSMAWGREMAEGYAGWSREKGIPERAMFGWFDTSNGVRDQIDALLAGPGRPDAIIAAPEGVAGLALDSARAAGLDVGRDLLIASYVDSDAIAVSQPGITALDLFPREMGRRCMDALANALDGAPRGERQEIPVRLIERGSTAGLTR